MTKIFVTTIDRSLAKKLQEDLADQGFTLSTPEYTIFSAKKPGLACVLYQSMKLTVQGRQMAEFLEFYLEPQILKNPVYTYAKELAWEQLDKRPRIGVDEAGKGDYFGPLCIAGVQADGAVLAKLIELGVRDSKTLSDDKIYTMAKSIVSIAPNYIIRLRPKKYNELYRSFRNLNSLLAWGHATVIEQLAAQTQTTLAVIDQFAHESMVERALRKKGVSIALEQRIRGESDIVVAAASILARWAFLSGLEEVGNTIGTPLPKGSSRHVVAAARNLVNKHGQSILEDVAKVHFKITLEVTGGQGALGCVHPVTTTAPGVQGRAGTEEWGEGAASTQNPRPPK